MAYTPQNNIERDLLWSQSKKGDMKKDRAVTEKNDALKTRRRAQTYHLVEENWQIEDVL